MDNKIIEIIESIYDSEIPCRMEWLFDGGYVWSIQNNDYPRLFQDNSFEDNIKIVAENIDNILLRNNPILGKDWIERGCNYSFPEAVKELASVACKHFPDSKFAQWYNPDKIK